MARNNVSKTFLMSNHVSRVLAWISPCKRKRGSLKFKTVFEEIAMAFNIDKMFVCYEVINSKVEC